MSDASGKGSYSDKRCIHLAFEKLRSEGYGAMMRLGFTEQQGISILETDQGARESYAFFTEQGDWPAFDTANNLLSKLPIYWRGNRAKVESAMLLVGLEILPGTEGEAVMLGPSKSRVQALFSEACSEAGTAFGLTDQAPKLLDEMRAQTRVFRERFRNWVQLNRAGLFPSMEEDAELIAHDDVYVKYLGFALPLQERQVTLTSKT